MNLSDPQRFATKIKSKEIMNMFNLVTRFWRIAEEKKTTPSEAALYFYLLNRANYQKWQMPIRCPTSIICAYISTSKQNVMKAREGLVRKGLITFIPGSGTNDSPLYAIMETSNSLSSQLSDELSGQLPGELSGQLPPLNNKHKYKEDITNNARKEDMFSLDELQNMFLEDKEWIVTVLGLLRSKNITSSSIENVKVGISQFFQYLKALGQRERLANDCKNHFVNWLIKQNLNKDCNNGENKQMYYDRRRAVEAIPAKSEDYEGSF